MQDIGGLIEGPNTYLADKIELYLFLKNRAGGGLGWGVEKKPGNQEI